MLLVFPAGKKKSIPTRPSKKGGWDVNKWGTPDRKEYEEQWKDFPWRQVGIWQEISVKSCFGCFFTKMAVWTSCISLNLQRRLQFWAVMPSYLPKSCTWEKTYRASTSCCLDELCVPLGQQLHDSCREVSPVGTARYTRICLWTNWRLYLLKKLAKNKWEHVWQWENNSQAEAENCVEKLFTKNGPLSSLYLV